MSGPLAGVNVLDVASMMAGPYGATLLGDLGAEVIKLEPPGGDPSRTMGPGRDGTSGVFHGVNRGKRSVVADLRTDVGRRVLSELLGWADVVVLNQLPSVRQKLGIDQATLDRYVGLQLQER